MIKPERKTIHTFHKFQLLSLIESFRSEIFNLHLIRLPIGFARHYCDTSFTVLIGLSLSLSLSLSLYIFNNSRLEGNIKKVAQKRDMNSVLEQKCSSVTVIRANI